MIHLVSVLSLLLALLATSQASADFAQGDAAYRQGDYGTALREFRPLAEQGDARAQARLGLLYYQGDGVPQDFTEALIWLRKAAQQGNAPAQARLGEVYHWG